MHEDPDLHPGQDRGACHGTQAIGIRVTTVHVLHGPRMRRHEQGGNLSLDRLQVECRCPFTTAAGRQHGKDQAYDQPTARPPGDRAGQSHSEANARASSQDAPASRRPLDCMTCLGRFIPSAAVNRPSRP